MAKGIEVYDAETDTILYNKYATNLQNLFDGIKATNRETDPEKPANWYYETDSDKDNGYAVYGQFVEVVKIPNTNIAAAKAYVKATGEEVDSSHYEVKTTTGEVIWKAEDAKITSTIVVEVPVTVKHPYCKGHNGVVKVEFVK